MIEFIKRQYLESGTNSDVKKYPSIHLIMFLFLVFKFVHATIGWWFYELKWQFYEIRWRFYDIET